MSPTIALHSRIFFTYLRIAIGILVLAGVILLILQHVFRKDVRSTWLTMVPLVAVAVFLGRTAVIAGTTLLAIFGFKEFARASGLYRDWWMTSAVYAAIVAVGYTAWMPDPFNTHIAGWFGLFTAMPVFGTGLLLIIPILRNRAAGQLQALALSILGFLYIGWMFAHLGYLANSHDPYGYLLYVVLATELNDVAAFTFGRLFGRHPLRSNISPRKTWEGAVGALCVSMLVPWALHFGFRHFETRQLLLAGLIVGIGGQLGDLSISVIKRDIGIKDMGSGIPGHGGVLDRIDALLFVGAWVYAYATYFRPTP
jgi:phosphatidate cytidylyltransferase